MNRGYIGDYKNILDLNLNSLVLNDMFLIITRYS